MSLSTPPIDHKIFFTLCILCAFALWCAENKVYALENTFEIGVTVISNDTDAPTVPANVSASAISATEINLSWSASTDNTTVGGYKIYRDNSFVATSTALTFGDTGLASSTSYDYVVSAFDTSYNESVRSATSTAVTQAPPPPAPNPSVTETVAISTPLGGGVLQTSSDEVRIVSIVIIPGEKSADITIQTDKDTSFRSFIGLTSDYEMASHLSEAYSKSHNLGFGGLSPNTFYYFKVELNTPQGKRVSYRGQFVTKKLSEASGTTVPPLAYELRAAREEEEIILRWKNYRTEDFKGVRIIRSDRFYPIDIYDGKLIWEGDISSVVDSSIELNKTYYYTIFSRDKNGNYFRGPVIKVSSIKPLVPEKTYEDAVFNKSLFGKIKLVQGGISKSFVASSTQMDSSKPFYVEVAKNKISADTEFIIALFFGENGKVERSMILEPDEASGLYKGVVFFNGEEGYKTLVIETYGFNHKLASYVSGTLVLKNYEKVVKPQISLWQSAKTLIYRLTQGLLWITGRISKGFSW